MQVQKIIVDGYSKAVILLNKEGKEVNGVTIRFTKPTTEFQEKVAKTADEFIKEGKID